MVIVLKTALGVFLGLMLWSKKDEFGWIAEVIAIGAFSIIVLGILRENIANYTERYLKSKKIRILASNLTHHQLANDMSLSTIVTILQRHEDSWDIERLIEQVDKYKIRKSNGYESDEEIQSIRYRLQQIVDASKKHGWTPTH